MVSFFIFMLRRRRRWKMKMKREEKQERKRKKKQKEKQEQRKTKVNMEGGRVDFGMKPLRLEGGRKKEQATVDHSERVFQPSHRLAGST